MILNLKEVSIAVGNLDEALARFQSVLGMGAEEIQVMDEPPISSRFASIHIGKSSITLMESTQDGSPIARYVATRGEGIFSITLLVDDLEQETRRLRDLGVDMVLDEPMKLRDVRAVDRVYTEVLINFTRPTSLHGVVFEFQEVRE